MFCLEIKKCARGQFWGYCWIFLRYRCARALVLLQCLYLGIYAHEFVLFLGFSPSLLVLYVTPGNIKSPFAYIRRQIQEASLKEWQQIWTTAATGKRHGYCNIAQRQRDWKSSWKPTKLITSTDQTTASTIYQLRLGHGYFKSFLIHLPSYDSTQCQCSERVQSVKHLLLGCRLYQGERRQAGITRETTLHSLLFTPKGATALQNFIQMTKVATRRWLLRRADEREGEGEWGWGRLRKGSEPLAERGLVGR